MEKKIILQVKGNNGRLLIFDDSVYFERKSILGNLDSVFFDAKTGYGHEKLIYFDMINSVEWNNATMLRNGYISLGVEGEIKNMSAMKGALKDANSLIFFPKSNEDAKKCVDYINKKIQERYNQTTPTFQYTTSSLSAADEIRKFKQLLDDGIITQEEFDQKKKQLLG